MSGAGNTLWLRCEKKPFERRAAITPTTAKKLIAAGYTIIVERDEQRIFEDEEYEAAGCKLVENNSWPTAPLTIPIIGLKELPVSSEPLQHVHVHFAHCYKNQAGWESVLARFFHGGGTLYDLEFLQDESGRRVAAFGFHAGFAGVAAGLLAYAALHGKSTLGKLEPFLNESEMVSTVKAKLGTNAKAIKVLVMGALGRCGRGAVDLLRKVGLEESNILKWDLEETAKGGPFLELLDVDIFVNCIYLSSKIPSFLTVKEITEAGPSRRLSIIVDVSCDTSNPNNPIPVYDINTTFDKPTVGVPLNPGLPPLEVISIDHLPTLLPREASEQFSNDLLPSLVELRNRQTARVWTEAKDLFEKKRYLAVEALGLEEPLNSRAILS